MNLGINGQSVTRTQLGYTVLLGFSDGHSVSIEVDFSNYNQNGRFAVTLDTGISDANAYQINQLRDAIVSTATVNDSGTLELKFENGSEITVNPHPDFDSWTFGGLQGTEIVCMPGGELAIYDH